MGRPLGEGQGPKYSGLTSHKKFRWSCSSRFYHGFTERLNSKERKDIIENYLKYKQKIKQVETELHNYLLNSKLLDVELKTLMENDNILQLKRITSSAKNKASLISKIKLNIDLLKLQEKNIINRLTIEEKLLYKELLDLDKKFDSWKINSNIRNSNKVINYKASFFNNRLTDFPPELTEFEEFIMCSGPTGGWEEYDHKLFLKYRNKFQTQDIFLKQLSKHIIGKSYENIEEHEKWYKEYLEKKQKKQTAILNWKIEKEKEQTKKFIYEKEKKLVGMKNNLNDEMIRTKKLKAIALWKLRKEEQQKNNEKNQKQLALQENKLKEKKKKEQISVTGRTDPSRIFQCTTSWKEKLKKDLTHIPVLSYTIQHKAIPEWRKNINAEKVFHKLPC
ncbi:coiled-coil domain-containing protein 112-like isoform X2 [Centruroides sculpturatus]|uniref:coiled-coil domain-containing protein 112-like isoform X2 n=1 Tax=Centruroides sculpturatus TaxID=218467 RepID=UPI000C6CCAA8|nr:coiled-coil domain-containing protein 112-like isoform X2 [Centruroides sculpturatus]